MIVQCNVVVVVEVVIVVDGVLLHFGAPFSLWLVSFRTSCRQQMKRKTQLETVIVCLFLRVQLGTKLPIIVFQTHQKSLGIVSIPRLFQKSGKNSGIFGPIIAC